MKPPKYRNQPTEIDGIRTCKVGGCAGNAHYKAGGARGLCSRHYQRWWVHGDALAGRTPEGEAQRFFDEVVLPYDGDACLEWPFGRIGGGYGQIHTGGKHHLVHRLVCEAQNGPPPSRKHEAAHSCGNRPCCNRRHLRWATIAENQADRLAHGTDARGERNYAAKLTERDVLEIRSLKGTVSEDKLAARFNVSRGTVSCVMQRKTWAWL